MTTEPTTEELDEPQVDDEVAELEEPLPEQVGEHAADEQVDAGRDGESASKEAMRYRLDLRAAEQRLTELAQRVETMQKGEIERIAGKVVQKPSSLWAAGVQVADLLDARGDVDPELVTAATTKAAEDLGLTKPRPGLYVPSEGNNPRHPGTRGDMEGVIRGGA